MITQIVTKIITKAAHYAASAVGIATLLEQRQIDKFWAQWHESVRITPALVVALLLCAALVVYVMVAYRHARAEQNNSASAKSIASAESVAGAESVASAETQTTTQDDNANATALRRFAAFPMRIAQTCSHIPPRTQTRLCNLAIIAYFVFILHFLLFSRTVNEASHIQLVPFQWYDGVWHESRVISAAANTALFVPYGFLLCCKRLSLPKCLAALLCTSLFCEIMQYITLLGNFKTENLITTVIGGCVGWFLCGKIKLYLFAKEHRST